MITFNRVSHSIRFGLIVLLGKLNSAIYHLMMWLATKELRSQLPKEITND